MRHAKSPIGATLLFAFILLFGGTLLNREGVAQVQVQPERPVFAQPAPAQSESRTLPEQQALPHPVVEIGDLMRLFNKPLFVGLKEVMSQQPASQKEWDDIQARGLQAAEIANLVAIRQVDVPRELLLQGAGGLQRAGVDFANAAKTRDWNATQQAYHGVVQACNKCHQAAAPENAPQLEP